MQRRISLVSQLSILSEELSNSPGAESHDEGQGEAVDFDLNQMLNERLGELS